MDLVKIIGISASIFTSISLLPQLIKLLKEKSAENVSMGMLLVLLAGLAFWIWYGFLKNDWIIVISNLFSLIINLIIIFFSFKYKKSKYG